MHKNQKKSVKSALRRYFLTISPLSYPFSLYLRGSNENAGYNEYRTTYKGAARSASPPQP